MNKETHFYQIPRNSLLWMLAAQFATIAPHWQRLSLWVLGICAVCFIWRLMVYLGRWSYPSRWIKTILVVTAIIGIRLSYGSVSGLDSAVALLVLAFVFKLLEMKQKRDAYIVVFLAYFTAIIEFLYNQSIPMTAYVLVVTGMITAALIGLTQTVSHQRPAYTLKLSFVLLLQSIPLMIILFIFFPRVEPLWSINVQKDRAISGVSDSMSPGDISRLTLSDDLAFRVTFEGELPSMDQLYWRGLVLSEFDGREWTQLSRGLLGPSPVQWPSRPKPFWDDYIERIGDEVRYTVVLEPTNQKWLFALPSMIPEGRSIGLVRDYRLYSSKRVLKRLKYEVTSFLDYRVEPEMTAYWQKLLTLLPRGSNPESRQLAEALYSRSEGTEDYIEKVLQMFNQEQFVYTLDPPPLGKNTVDEFLLNSRRGFCEHYASSFAFMMRAVAIPSRVVVGYQGGEYNSIGNYLAVHQFDAHAWAEVWISGKGWIRVDPTKAVAPERIESGMQAAVQEQGFLEDSSFSWLRYRQSLWISDLRLQLSAIEYYWDSWIVGYNPSMQMQFLARYFDDVDFVDMGIMLLGFSFVAMAILALFLLWRKERTSVSLADREYFKFCTALARIGFARKPGEGPLNYAGRVEQSLPGLKHQLDRVTRIYLALNYAEIDDYRLKDLKRAIRAFRLKTLKLHI